MQQRHISVVLIVVGNIALIGLIYMATLAACCVWNIDPKPELLSAMKDVGLVAIGALTGLLARTSTGADVPVEAHVTNKPNDPVPTEPSP